MLDRPTTVPAQPPTTNDACESLTGNVKAQKKSSPFRFIACSEISKLSVGILAPSFHVMPVSGCPIFMTIAPSVTFTSPSPPKSVIFQPSSVLPSNSTCQPPCPAPPACWASDQEGASDSPNTAARQTRLRIMAMLRRQVG